MASYQVFFPYDNMRAEQKLLMEEIAKTIAEQKTFLAHAPTGLGKTVSSLAPALSYALKEGKKVFFLTPKISQHEIVLETAQLMNKKFNLGIRAIDLVGKKQMCLDPFLSRVGYGFYEACSKKKKDKQCKYFNNTKGFTPKQKAIANRRKADILKKYNCDHDQLKELCRMKELCPYEITLEMVKRADLIICDYFYLFDEDIREAILGPAGIVLSDCIVVVDEAHNLSSRLRDLLSSELDVNVVDKAAKEAKNVGDFTVEFLMNDIGKEIMGLGKKLSLDRGEAVLGFEDIDLFKRIVRGKNEAVSETALKYMTKTKSEGSFLLHVDEFLTDLSREKENTLHLIERRNGLRVSINPMDASEIAADVLNNAHSSILMSGTLLPLRMHADILGIGSKRLVTKEYKSPFDPKNRLNIFVDKTTTKYTSRSDEQIEEIADVIEKVISKVPGNTIVFFPSFEMLERISPLLRIQRKVLKQEREMSPTERTNLIHNFKLLGSGFGGVLLAVSGGSIAEGIDFPGEHLLCAIIVGIPFAKVSVESEAMIRFFDKKFGNGWDYAYNAPAIAKAVQAAGRVIRTETDRGVCVFLDQRFSEERYKKFYPLDFSAKVTKEPEKLVEEFFRQ